MDQVINISKRQFEELYLKQQRPVIILEGIKQWKALKKWSPSYFSKVLGHKEIKVGISKGDTFSYNKQHRDQYIKFRHMTMKKLVDKITNPHANSKYKYYLIHQSFKENFPELLGDFNIPSWGNIQEHYSTNLWFGESNNVTPLHFDYSHNFIAQVYGRKKLRLYSPHDSQFLYPTYDKLPPNHSNILDINNPDYKKFPKFTDAIPIDVTLNPGDALFLPAGWWHQVKSLDISMSINFWWLPNIKEAVLSHALRYRLKDIYKKNTFASEVKHLVNLSEYSNYLEVSDYLAVQNYYKWVSIIFLGAYLKEYSVDTNNTIVLNIFRKKLNLNGKIYSVSKLVNLALKEDDTLFSNIDISIVNNYIKNLLIKT